MGIGLIRDSLAIQWFVSPLLAFMLLGAGAPSEAQTMCSAAAGKTCVLTWQNDNYRTGQNLNETAITYQSFGNPNFEFGQLCSVPLDGQVYAQPLVVTNVTIPPLTGHLYKSVVYVVTENDTLYALQGDPTDAYKATCSVLNGSSGTPLLQFLPANSYPVNCYNVGAMYPTGCQTIAPSVGILGTPVINISANGTSGTIYLVTATQQGCSGRCTPSAFAHYLPAIDIAGFTEGGSGRVPHSFAFLANEWVLSPSHC
jgi:hypothetical protein